jgi:hypothetical protein
LPAQPNDDYQDIYAIIMVKVYLLIPIKLFWNARGKKLKDHTKYKEPGFGKAAL